MTCNTGAYLTGTQATNPDNKMVLNFAQAVYPEVVNYVITLTKGDTTYCHYAAGTGSAHTVRANNAGKVTGRRITAVAAQTEI